MVHWMDYHLVLKMESDLDNRTDTERGSKMGINLEQKMEEQKD